MTRATLTAVCLYVLAFLLNAPEWSRAETAKAKVQVRVPAAQATFDVELPAGPNAAELSKPGALQAYVDSKHDKGEVCQLPPGVITGNLFIDSDAMLRSLDQQLRTNQAQAETITSLEAAMSRSNRKSLERYEQLAIESNKWGRQVAERVSIEPPPEPPALSPFPARRATP